MSHRSRVPSLARGARRSHRLPQGALLSRAALSRAALSRAALSALVWAICAVLGAAPALPALHFALVAHRVCPEHGELLHVDEPGNERPAAALAGEPLRVPALQAGSSAAAGPHSHDVCSAFGGSASSTLAGAAAILTLAACALPAMGLRRALAHRCVALLDYAPKLAPPLAPARVS